MFVIAVTSRDRHAAMDERERGFDRRATCAGYYLLLAGALPAAATAHLGVRPADMANAVLPRDRRCRIGAPGRVPGASSPQCLNVLPIDNCVRAERVAPA